ncbi:hypothetical protein CFIO01_07422 [Colletotrichum fioriniae PJ7]|uniref:Ankyrin repeat protein n=1 Tax=Colletotrichum fioriniae PJ7 TaxID=1445577 RepID=A0A010SEX3_9PEZI|nr:hypothetical protein CFIO01_07422 [Colletotrichum fioriniae PJ7]
MTTWGTPLYRTAAGGRFEMVEWLLDQNVDTLAIRDAFDHWSERPKIEELPRQHGLIDEGTYVEEEDGDYEESEVGDEDESENESVQGNLESGVEEDVVKNTGEYEEYGYESTFEIESEAERLEDGELEELSDSGLEDEDDDDEDEDVLDEWGVEERVWGRLSEIDGRGSELEPGCGHEHPISTA